MAWATIHATFGLPQPVPHMFGIWQRGISAIFKYLVLLGATATCWSLWRNRNSPTFQYKQPSFLQVTFHNFALASHMGYPPKANYTGFSCSGIQEIDTNGRGFFFTQAYGQRVQSRDLQLLVCILSPILRLCVFFAEARIFFQVVPYNFDVTIIEFNNKIPLLKKLWSMQDI